MPFDASVVACLAKEINMLLPVKIDQIHQPFRDEYLFSCHGSGESFKILISLHPRFSRFHLYRGSKVNPPRPAPFCMLLRKHFGGAKLVRLEAAPFERAVKLDFETYDPARGVCRKLIWLELTGRNSNMVVCDEAGLIIDAWRRTTVEKKDARLLTAGVPYESLPTRGRWQPLGLSPEQFAALIGRLPERVTLAEFLPEHWLGLSALAVTEITRAAALNPTDCGAALSLKQINALHQKFAAWSQAVLNGDFQPGAIFDPEGVPLDCWAFGIDFPPAGTTARPVTSLNETLAEMLERRQQDDRFHENRQNLLHQIHAQLEKCRNKLHKQEAEATEAENGDQWRINGELLTVYGQGISKGSVTVALPNHYDPEGSKVAINLNPALSARENAQLCFKKYRKAKKGQLAIAAQLTKTRETLEYLESLETLTLNSSTCSDLDLVREEFLQSYGKRKNPAQKGPGPAKKDPAAKPRQFSAPAGHTVLVGRNNLQNDKLTFKLASPNDWWFHAQKIPGSHVILKLLPGTEADEASLNFACRLAAYFSKARESTKTPVDYTRRKYVKKPPGAKPGFVIYENFQTALVTPDPDLSAAAEPGND